MVGDKYRTEVAAGMIKRIQDVSWAANRSRAARSEGNDNGGATPPLSQGSFMALLYRKLMDALYWFASWSPTPRWC